MATRKAHEVDAFLRRPDPAFALFLVYGPNAGLVNERARHLARGYVEDPEDAFQLVKLEGDEIASDPARLADEAGTIGLFGGRRSIWVRAGSKNLTPLVQPLVAAPPTDARVVLEAGDLAARNPLRALVEGAKTGVALPCYADEARDIPTLVDGILQEFGLSADRESKELLRQILAPDRLLIRREMEKLAAYAQGARQITAGDVEAVMADAAASVLDAVLDALFLGDMDALDRGLGRLFQEGEDAGVLVGAGLRHAMTLHKARVSLDLGGDMDRVTDAARVFFKRKSAFQRQLTKWSRPALESAIATLREAQAQARRMGALSESLASRAFITVAMRASRS